MEKLKWKQGIRTVGGRSRHCYFTYYSLLTTKKAFEMRPEGGEVRE